jgi:DNA end-binding protein Ku
MSGSPRHRAGRSHPSEALEGKAGIGKLALYGREYSVAIQPRGKGLVMYTLRRAKEVRSMGAIDEIEQLPAAANEAEVALARQVIGNFEGEIDLGDFEDEYQAELRSVIDAKIAGEEFVVQEEEAPAKVVDLMAALRKSLDSVSQSKKTPARSATAAKATKAKRKRA